MSATIDHSIIKPKSVLNPMGTDGFEFIEYTAKDTKKLSVMFQRMGFKLTSKHRSKDVERYSQGDVNFLINHEPNSFAQSFANKHGSSACAFAIRVSDAAYAMSEP